MYERVYILNPDDFEKLKDCTIGMRYEDVMGNQSEDERQNTKRNNANHPNLEETSEKIDIIRKAYLFDLYMLQNKYGVLMNNVISDYKSGVENDKK